MGRGPIFIGGLGSSGKTLLGLMLSSHPNVALTRRTFLWSDFYNRYGDIGQFNNFERCLTAILHHRPIRVLKPDPARIRREFWLGEPTYARLFALLHDHYAQGVGKARWGNQTRLVVRYVDLILAAYPEARIIHMIRNPRDRYEASLISSPFQIGKVGPATATWLDSTALAKRNQQRYPERHKVVRYETLMCSPEETLREICTFLEEEFAPGILAMKDALRFDENKGNEAEADFSKTGIFGRGMSEREVAVMQAGARRAMLTYGYQLQPVELSLRDRLLLYFLDWPVSLARTLAWRSVELIRRYCRFRSIHPSRSVRMTQKTAHQSTQARICRRDGTKRDKPDVCSAGVPPKSRYDPTYKLVEIFLQPVR
jgi:hypothetical protein